MCLKTPASLVNCIVNDAVVHAVPNMQQVLHHVISDNIEVHRMISRHFCYVTVHFNQVCGVGVRVPQSRFWPGVGVSLLRKTLMPILLQSIQLLYNVQILTGADRNTEKFCPEVV